MKCLVLGWAASGLLLLTSCHGSQRPAIELEGLVLCESEPLVLTVGTAQDFAARPVPASAPLAPLVWTSSDPAVATVSDTGRVRAQLTGVATISAEVPRGPSAQCQIRVDPYSESVAGCDNANPGQIDRFPDCANGGGVFGQWIVDELGMPAFSYTLPQLLNPMGKWSDSTGSERQDHFLVLGNDRFNFKATNQGIVEVFTNDRAPTWLNRFDADQQNLGGGFSYVHDLDDDQVWSSAYFLAPHREDVRRVWGVGYFEHETCEQEICVRHRLVAPAGDDPVLIDQVTVRNESDRHRHLAHFEYFDVNRHQLKIQWVRTGLAAGVGDNERDQLNDNFEQEVAYDAGQQVLTALWQPAPGVTPLPSAEPSPTDWYPPPIFLAALDAPVTAVHADQSTWFGSGTLAEPEAAQTLALQGALSPTSAEGQPACLVMQANLSLAPGESRTLRFGFGYLPPGRSIDLLDTYRDPASDPLALSLDSWRERLAYVWTPGRPLWHRETAWRSHLLLGHTVYNSYYQQHYTPQGSTYLYLHGADGAPRDQLLFAVPLTYLDPDLAKGNFRQIMAVTDSTTGQKGYSFTGYGITEGATAHEHPSDLDIFFLWAMGEYLSATGDFAFLRESVSYHPRDTGRPVWVKNDSVLEHIRNAFIHLRDTVGVGDHGLINLNDGDWSDGIVYEDLSPAAIAFTIEHGESVPNTQMALVALPLLADQIAFWDSALADEMRAFAATLRAPVVDAFGQRWFARAWLRNTLDQPYLKGNDAETDPFAANYIDLEAQPWGLLADVLTAAQRETVLDEIEIRLDEDSSIGPRLRPGGQVWPAISQLMTWAYARYRPHRAWKAMDEQLYTTHAAIWPQQWMGIWSGPDGFLADGTDGGTWVSPVTPMTDFPVANMNPEAMWLFGLLRVAGVESLPEGLLFTVRGGGPDQLTLDLPLLRVETSSRRVRVEYRPHNVGQRTFCVAVPPDSQPSVWVDDQLRSVPNDNGRVCTVTDFIEGRPVVLRVSW